MQYMQSIELDVTNCNLYKCIYAKQGDSKSRYIKATILINGERVMVSRDMKAVFRAVKPDGNAIYNPAIVNEDGTVMVELTQQTLAVEGMVDADILIMSSDGEELSTAPFKIDVEMSPCGDKIDSDNEFLELIQMIRRGEEVIKKAEDAAGKIGDLSSLQTDAKDNLVDAINEAAASGGADWNQNDPTAKDYVKNRPGAYKVEKEMKVAVTPDDTNGVTLESFPSFKSGETISFAVNSVKYSVEAIELFPDMPGIAGFRDAKGGWEIACPFGEEVFASSKTEAINITYTAVINEVIPNEFLPSNIVYLKDGSIPTSLLPTDISVFGSNIAAGGSYSTLSNPYPNKVQMPDLTLDKFNQMLNGNVYLPMIIVCNHSLASVSVNKVESCIYVHWNEIAVYGTDGHAIAGASITAYEAKIHEDPKNKGSIISEYAMIKIADNRLA